MRKKKRLPPPAEQTKSASLSLSPTAVRAAKRRLESAATRAATWPRASALPALKGPFRGRDVNVEVGENV